MNNIPFPQTTRVESEEPDWGLLEYMLRLEDNWQENLYESLPKTEAGWLEIFPEARGIIKTKIQEWSEVGSIARKATKVALTEINKIYPEEQRWFGRAVLKHTNPSVRELAIARRNIKRLTWLLPSKSTGISKWKESLKDARQVPITEIAKLYDLRLRKSGKSYQALCPFHKERTPSFYLYPPSRFVCFGCGEKGDVITFVQKIAACSFKEAVFKLAKI